MGTEQGRDTRIFIKTGDTVFTKIGGETTHSFNANSQDIDTSDKDGGSGTYGQRKIAISISGNTKLPDLGLETLSTASKASPPQIEIKIMRGTALRFHGLVGIGNLKWDNPLGLATWSADMMNAATPIVEDLTATDD